jgi:hypothetical protein
MNGIDVEKMNKRIEEMKISRKRETLDKWLKEKYKISIEDMKRKIAYKSINLTRTKKNRTLLVQMSRYGSIHIKEQKYRIRVSFFGSGFWFKFPIYYFHDLPSGLNIGGLDIGKNTKNGIELLNDDGKLIRYLSKEYLKEQLLEDLMEYNFIGFNDTFDDFLNDLYEWSLKVK